MKESIRAKIKAVSLISYSMTSGMEVHRNQKEVSPMAKKALAELAGGVRYLKGRVEYYQPRGMFCDSKPWVVVLFS